jgi:type IX secretion system PorP/SprF family membrane protein
MKITRLLLAITVILGINTAKGQDIHFSQFYMTPLKLNPALAGAEYDIRGFMNYRNQWKSVTTPFVTYMASYDMNFANQKNKTGFWAAGISAFSDKAGDSRMVTNQMNLSGAYHVYLNNNSTLGLGVQAGFFQRSVDMTELQWGSQYNGLTYDPSLSTGESASGMENFMKPDFSTGINYSFRKSEHYTTANDQILINTGISIQHANKPGYNYQEVNFDKLHFRWVGHFNALIGIPNTLFSAQPGILFMQQGGNREFLLGSNILYKFKEESKYTGYVKGGTMSLGLFYRNRDAFVITSMMEFANYAIGISYDINSSYLKTESSGRGAFELALRYVLPSPFGNAPKSRSRFN